MGEWAEFAIAFGAFLLSHAIPARPAVRARLRAILGEGGFLAAYSLVSVILLGWLIAAAGRAPYVALWDFAPWQMWVPNLLMPLACILVAFGAAAPNPLSFGGRAVERFDARHPGIAGVSRHPLLLGLLLWAAGHIVPNGDLAHVILFGTFAAFSLAGMRMIDRRRQRTIGRSAWDALAARTSLWPGEALFDGRWRPSLRRLDPVRLGIAGVLWAALLSLHAPVIGVSPLPPL
ncbi:NnrU family protein [Rhodopila globiformis]|uniref:NnrU family protein n=1 Tax=Rhodopila globiformis TaxID=1071 RepID=A0A2S6N4X4_RHOGL|nr:NnrU family protein [Rhodopila globiformis]PPQ29670.1 NnrU family protein [Rhodopila globiformis]